MARFRFTYPSGLSVVVPQSEVFNEIYYDFPTALCENGIPLAQEVEGWSELCYIGERFISDKFVVECISDI